MSREKFLVISAVAVLGSVSTAFAGGLPEEVPIAPAAVAPAIVAPVALWSVLAGIGYSRYQDSYSSDNDTAAGRLALGLAFPTYWQALDLGFETGIQNGNSMKLSAVQGSSQYCGISGTTSIQTTVKPIVDLLATAQLSLNDAKTIFLVAKGGAAYRKWQFDRDSISNNSQINPEVQAGLGIRITPKTKLIAYYQGIYGRSVHVHTGINRNGAMSIRCIENIPTQQGGFLSIAMDL